MCVCVTSGVQGRFDPYVDEAFDRKGVRATGSGKTHSTQSSSHPSPLFPMRKVFFRARAHSHWRARARLRARAQGLRLRLRQGQGRLSSNVSHGSFLLVFVVVQLLVAGHVTAGEVYLGTSQGGRGESVKNMGDK